MYDTGKISKQELEVLEMFKLFNASADLSALLKTHIKKWEYKLYNGIRPEIYPQDRKAILTLVQFKNERAEKEHKHKEKQDAMKQKMQSMGLSGSSRGQ